MENHHFQWENSLFHTISMAMFNSYVTNYQRVNLMLWNEIPINWPIRHDPTSKSSNFLMPGGGHSTGATIATWVTWWEKNRRIPEDVGGIWDSSRRFKVAKECYWEKFHPTLLGILDNFGDGWKVTWNDHEWSKVHSSISWTIFSFDARPLSMILNIDVSKQWGWVVASDGRPSNFNKRPKTS